MLQEFGFQAWISGLASISRFPFLFAQRKFLKINCTPVPDVAGVGISGLVLTDFRFGFQDYISGLISGFDFRIRFRAWCPGMGFFRVEFAWDLRLGFQVWISGLDFRIRFQDWIPGLVLRRGIFQN